MSLRHAALGLLANGPASGYDLLQAFQVSLANVWPATQSQLYTELNRLAEAGLVTVAAEGRRGRKEYAITEAGLAELRHWLADVEPTVRQRNDMLLRVFFLDVLDRDQAGAYLGRRAEASAAQHAALREIEAEISDEWGPLAVYGRIALEWGLRFSAMQQEWATWAVDRLAAEPLPTNG